MAERGEAVALDPAGALALRYVVVLSTLIGFRARAWLLTRHPACEVAPFTLFVPVAGIAVAWLAAQLQPGFRKYDARDPAP